MPASHRLQTLLQHLQPNLSRPTDDHVATHAASANPPQPLNKICTAQEALQLVNNNDVVTVAGFVGSSCPDLLLQALRTRFNNTHMPRDLTLLYVASAADGKEAGLNRLAARGLVAKLIYAWTGSAPQLAHMVRQGHVQAWNLPLGVVSHMIRDVAAKRVGPITHIGLHTFVDPRNKGGRLNAATKENLVEVVELGGEERLWYKAPQAIHIALLRGTTADTAGNISLEREPLYLDQLYQAMAAHNSGGKVIVQVERIVASGSIPSRLVHIPGALVDKVVVSPASTHPMSFGWPVYDGTLTGEVVAPSEHVDVLPPGVRRVIAHRAMMVIGPDTRIVNLGVGMPEGVANMIAAVSSHHNPHALHAQLTVEAGTFGGIPLSGNRFGTSRNASCYIPTATMLDFYQGSGLDMAVLGMAQVDLHGNVNVSRFGNRMPGCGGFIDISQTSKVVCFVGTFTTGGLKASVGNGKLTIHTEGTSRKFRHTVEETTFVGSAAPAHQRVLYITERAVFGLRKGRMVLLEVAPGVDVERDVLGQMDFVPDVAEEVGIMDARLFQG